MEKNSGWKSAKDSRMNLIIGNDSNPTKFSGGETIINKKATKKNLDRLVEINNDGSGKTTTDASDGGLLTGPSHDDGGIPGIVGGVRQIETEGDEFVVSQEASEKHWKELSAINQSTGGVAINKPSGADDDPEEYKEGGKIKFQANKLPNKRILNYAEKIKAEYPKVWDLGGNIFGNQAFKNLKRVSERGFWLDSEEWMFIKWRSYVARHQKDFRIEGVIAMLKWVDTVDRGWAYMKDLIDAEVKKRYPKKMKDGGRTIAQTPAPKKDRIKGSKVNPAESSESLSKASSIKFSAKTLSSIKAKIEEHNEAHPDKKITLASAKAVVRRGMGAYSSTHRPTISGGQPNDRTAWGLARLNAFTYKIVHGKSKSGKYTQDDDLINELGYSVSKMNRGGNIEYQSRDLNGTMVYYKRKSGGKWEFISKDEFEKNANEMNIVKFKDGGSIEPKSFVVFFKSNFLNNIIYTNIESDSLSLNEAIEIQKQNYSWLDIEWIKGFETNKGKSKMEFFLQNIKPKWETKPDLSVEMKDGQIVFSKGRDSVAFDVMTLFKNVSNENHQLSKFNEAYMIHGDVEIRVDSDFNFDRNKIFELMLDKMKDGGELDEKSGIFLNGKELTLVEAIEMYKNDIKELESKERTLSVQREIEALYKTQKILEIKYLTEQLYKTRSETEYKRIEKQINKLKSKYDDGGSVDGKDTVTVDIPLMIRLLELSREDVKSDAELHMVVERLLDLKNKSVLTMDDYAYIAEIEHKHLNKYDLGGKIPASERKVDLGFGGLGNGITVWDRNRIHNNDYKIVAHISDSGNITYYDKGLPNDAINQIESLAQNERKRYEDMYGLSNGYDFSPIQTPIN